MEVDVPMKLDAEERCGLLLPTVVLLGLIYRSKLPPSDYISFAELQLSRISRTGSASGCCHRRHPPRGTCRSVPCGSNHLRVVGRPACTHPTLIGALFCRTWLTANVLARSTTLRNGRRVWWMAGQGHGEPHGDWRIKSVRQREGPQPHRRAGMGYPLKVPAGKGCTCKQHFG